MCQTVLWCRRKFSEWTRRDQFDCDSRQAHCQKLRRCWARSTTCHVSEWVLECVSNTEQKL